MVRPEEASHFTLSRTSGCKEGEAGTEKCTLHGLQCNDGSRLHEQPQHNEQYTQDHKEYISFITTSMMILQGTSDGPVTKFI